VQHPYLANQIIHVWKLGGHLLWKRRLRARFAVERSKPSTLSDHNLLAEKAVAIKFGSLQRESKREKLLDPARNSLVTTLIAAADTSAWLARMAYTTSSSAPLLWEEQRSTGAAFVNQPTGSP